jgi:hypothetical protein
MPALMAHFSLAKNLKSQSGIISPHSFYLGAQGPDPYFYYGRVKIKKRKNILNQRDYGSLLHHEDYSLTLETWIKEVWLHPELPFLKDYVKGLMLHYSLDSLAHPFVTYRGGWSYCLEEKELYRMAHLSYETLLDVSLIKARHLSYSTSYPLKIKGVLLKTISQEWMVVSHKSNLGINIQAKTFLQAYKDYKFYLSYANGIYPLSKELHKLLYGERSRPYCLAYPHNLKKYEGIDFLNLQHEKWLDPIIGLEHHESYLDLESLAGTLYFKLIKLLEEPKNDKELDQEVTSLTRRLNHDGMLKGQVRHFGSPVWQEKEEK